MNNSSEFAIIVGEMASAVGITGVVCCPLLIVVSAVEVLYICRYKTTFLQRLFFYLTIAATIQEGANVFMLGYGKTEATMFLVIMFASQSYVLIVELLLVGSINFTVLSKMYKYRASVGRQLLQSNAEYMLGCCFYTKIREFTLVFFAFGVLLLIAVIEAVTVPLEPFAGIYIFSAAIEPWNGVSMTSYRVCPLFLCVCPVCLVTEVRIRP